MVSFILRMITGELLQSSPSGKTCKAFLPQERDSTLAWSGFSLLFGQGRQTSWETSRYSEPALLASTRGCMLMSRHRHAAFLVWWAKIVDTVEILALLACEHTGWLLGIWPPVRQAAKKIIHSTLWNLAICNLEQLGGGRGALEKYSKIFYQARNQKDTGENYGFFFFKLKVKPGRHMWVIKPGCWL